MKCFTLVLAIFVLSCDGTQPDNPLEASAVQADISPVEEIRISTNGCCAGNYAVTLDETEQVHLLFVGFGFGPLNYARPTEAGWVFQELDGGGMVLTSTPDLALDAQGIAHVSYARWYSRSRILSDLVYTTSDSNWYKFYVERLDYCQESSIEIDDSGAIHIAYYVGYPDYEIRYVRRTDGTQDSALIDSTSGRMPQLLLDDESNPRIAYISQEGVTVAKQEDGLWTKQVITSPPALPGAVGVTQDDSGLLHIVYRTQGADGSDLVYAQETTDGWATNIVDVGDVGYSPAITVDHNGITWIAYNSSSPLVRVAYQHEGNWRMFELESEARDDSTFALVNPRVISLHDNSILFTAVAKRNGRLYLGKLRDAL